MDAPRGEGRGRRPVRSRYRLWCFRGLAVLLGLLPLVGVELALRLAGAGADDELRDPLIGFSAVRPLFELNRGVGRYEIPVARQVYFRPESFPARKAVGTFRIFCFGGSTVQGRPYATETAFSSWLRLTLEAVAPDRSWEVINCGGVSYASYRLAPIVEEALAYEPDLVILYTGHNEFLEDRTYEALKRTPAWWRELQAQAGRLSVYRVLRRGWLACREDAPRRLNRLPGEVDARLDYRGGLEQYHRDPDWRAGVVLHFELNVRRMVALAQRRGVPVLLVNPVANLKDSPPFKFEHRAQLTPEQLTRFGKLWDAAQDPRQTLNARIELLQQAVQIDDQHAAVCYQLGKCLEASGQTQRALHWLIRAKDQDICPLRILEEMREAIRRVGSDQGVPVIDVWPRFARASRDGIPGREVFVDHVHPTIEAHQWIAELLVEAMRERDMVRFQAGWEQRRAQQFRRQMETLEPMYFARASERLEGLRRWTEGRAFKVKPLPGVEQP